MQELGLHRLGCAFSINETLANAAQMHHLDPNVLYAFAEKAIG